jgi:DNA processing protein
MPELPEDEANVFAAVGSGEASIDGVVDVTGLPAHVVSATLMKLEMRKLVRCLPGFRYARR